MKFLVRIDPPRPKHDCRLNKSFMDFVKHHDNGILNS